MNPAESLHNGNTPRDVSPHRYSLKVTWIGLFINVLLSGIKFTAGVIGASQAVVADAVHSLSDSITDIAVIVGSYFWSRPPDNCHPYGHRRIETLVTICIGGALIIAGAGIGWQAVSTFHQQHTKPPGWIAAFAALLSIICKEILYQWTAYAGKKIKSPALIANAWHHRLDAFSSMPVLIAVGGAIIFPKWSFLDHLGAVIVSVFIIQAGLKIIWPGICEFIDSGAPEKTCEMIKAIALENSFVKEVHGIRTRYIGTRLQVDMHLLLDGSLSISEGHKIAGVVKSRILTEGPDVVDVLIHIEPLEAGTADNNSG